MSLDVISLNFDYAEKCILRNVDFSLAAGCLLHIRGNNGAGKTTLLKLLAGLLYPTQGKIYYRGDDIHNDLAEYQQSICYVGHKTGVSQVLTAREHYRFELERGPCDISFNTIINRFALRGQEDIPCGLLSVGQRRRVGLLRILMSRASLWLLDEPLAALDHDAVTILMDCFAEHLDKGGQIIVTSHQPLPLLDRTCQDYCL